LFFLLYLLLHNWVNNGVPERDCPFDAQEVIIRVAIAVLNLKLLPNAPECLLVLARIAELTQVRVDAPCSLDLIELAFKLGEAETQLNEELSRLDPLKSTLVDFAGPSDPIELSCFGHVHVENLKKLISLTDFHRCPIINRHGM